jgi:hypothetical protein
MRQLGDEGHQFLEYDENHRGCARCGLRVFRSPTARGWTLVNYWGVPTSNLLADVSGGFGSCRPPPRSDLVVLIDYTGDPDRFPGCERFMHRLRESFVPQTSSAAGGSQIVKLGMVLPVCGFRPEFWELGPPRDHIGWTWCADCFPGEKRTGRRSDREQSEGPALPRARRPRELPPPAPRALPAPAPRALPAPALELPPSSPERRRRRR